MYFSVGVENNKISLRMQASCFIDTTYETKVSGMMNES